MSGFLVPLRHERSPRDHRPRHPPGADPRRECGRARPAARHERRLGPGGARERLGEPPRIAALDAAPCPSTTSLARPTVSPARIEAARERRFSVFGPRPTELDEPIDWHTDPLGVERYRQNLHKLRFLTPLLSSYAYDDQAADLDQAVAIGLDWVRHNPRGEPGTADEAWSSKVVRADHHRGACRRRRHVLDARGDPGSPQAHRDEPLGRRLAVRPTPATAEGSERPGSSPCETAPGLDRVPRAPSGRAR